MNKNLSASILIALSILVIVAAFATILPLPYGTDWVNQFKPAAIGTLTEGGKVYGYGYYNPPWVAMALVPIAILPEPYDRLVLFLATLLAFFAFAYRMKFSPLCTAFFLISAPVVACLWDGNIDAFILLGATLNPTIGLFFVLAKPQVGFIVAMFWFYQCLMSDRPFWKTLYTFYPVTIFFLFSFTMFGWWPGTINGVTEFDWNTAIFPYGVPIGLTLAITSVTRWDKARAIAASPFLSTYLSFNSWAGAYTILRKRPVWMLVAVVAPWVFIILKLTQGW